MSSLLYTTDNLVSEVRDSLDELNSDSVSTETSILPALNRAQDFAFDIYARRYPEPILAYTTLTLVSGQSEYDIAEDVFEDRILKIDIAFPNNQFNKVERISFRDGSDYETSGLTSAPTSYMIIGNKIKFIGTPSGTYNARVWYLRNPEKLVLPQGRVTRVNQSGNYVILDSTGSGLTTESDQLGSYVNVIDGQSGIIKKTLQISNINENKISFRSTPQRSSVLNRTVSGSFTTSDIKEDDYLCAIDGICVPYYGRPTGNFLIAYATAELNRKLGNDNAREEEILKKFEQQVERTWVGRERQMRVQKRNKNFSKPVRRWWNWGN
jgi:hypothetical protein